MISGPARSLFSLLLFSLVLTSGCGSGSKDEPNGKDTGTASIDTSGTIDVIDTTYSISDTADSSQDDPPPKEFKIGHLYSQEILLVMPQRIAIDKQLEDMAKQLENEIAAKYKEYETKYKRLMTDSALTESRQEALVNELASLQTTIEKLQASGQEDLLMKKEQLYQPMFDRINATIKRVAKAQGYTYIIDASQGSLVYGVDSYDITPLVKRELGLK